MRIIAVAVLSLMVGGTACSDSLDPKTADVSGTVMGVDEQANLLVNSGVFCTAVTAPCYDYTVHVTGKVFLERTPGIYKEIPASEIEMGSEILVWTDGQVNDTSPKLVQGTHVIVKYTATTFGGAQTIRR